MANVPLKIVYMGTPDFAVKPLDALLDAGYDVRLVLTQPDRARNRGKKVQPCPVRLRAMERGLETLTPERLKDDPKALEALRKAAPDLIVVAAYGQILTKEVLDLPPLGCVNIHASLLPEYRGAAPVQRAIMDGKDVTGVTIMYMAEKLDCGDMIASEQTPAEGKTASELLDELSETGARLLLKVIPELAGGTAKRVPQDDSKACYAKMIFKEDAHIDFSKTGRQICDLVRAMETSPGSFCVYGEENMKVHRASFVRKPAVAEPGTVLRADGSGIAVSCGDGEVVFENIQMPGKKAMDIKAFLLGNKIDIGTVLR